MYIRFEGPGGQGLFQLADLKLFRKRNDSCRDATEAKKLRAWLWRHTPSPPKWAYEPGELDVYPSTWFRDDFYRSHMRRAMLLSELLVARGVRLRVLRVETLPGPIVYKDKVQVVVWSAGGKVRGERVGERALAPRSRATIRGALDDAVIRSTSKLAVGH